MPGDSFEIKTKISPSDSTSLVTFVSSDESVAMVKTMLFQLIITVFAQPNLQRSEKVPQR